MSQYISGNDDILNIESNNQLPLFYMEILDSKVSLISIDEKEFKNLFYDLSIALFHKDTKNKFFSYTVTNNEISLFIDQELLSKDFLVKVIYPHVSLMYEDTYKVLQICEHGSGISHIGIVEKISSIFAKHNIPILYVNSVYNNYILVKEHDISNIIDILKTQPMFVIS